MSLSLDPEALWFPCSTAVCIEGRNCIGKKTGEAGLLRSYPSPCKVVQNTWVVYEKREQIDYAREDGFCVVYSPLKAVLPEEVCKLLDTILAGKPKSRALLGPGGTGKSLTLELIARTAPFNVVSFEPEAILRKFVGESEQELYKIFSECEQNEPCILLADETDILIRSRKLGIGMHSGTGEVTENLIRIILRRLQQWYNDKRDLAIIGASNYPIEAIDRSLLRAGRLGEPIYFPIPDKKAIKKLAQLYNKEISEEEITKFLRLGLPHSNIIDYFKTGEIQKTQPAVFAGLEYAPPAKTTRKLGVREGSRIVIAEAYPVGVRLAALISSTELDKPILYLRDPTRIQDLEYLGKSMKAAIAIPYTHYTSYAPVILYDYPHTIFYIGTEWVLPYYKVTLETILQLYGKKQVVEALCRDQQHPKTVNIYAAITSCLSNITI